MPAAPPHQSAAPAASRAPHRPRATVLYRLVGTYFENPFAHAKHTCTAPLLKYDLSPVKGHHVCGSLTGDLLCCNGDQGDPRALVAPSFKEGVRAARDEARARDTGPVESVTGRIEPLSSAVLCGHSIRIYSPPMVPMFRVGYAPRMQHAPASWVIDPDDPRAPPQELWDRMSSEERQRVVALLPSEIEVSQASPPEGDFHFQAKTVAKDTLSGYFQRLGRRVYLACELPVYYPNEPLFAPDLIAVLDVEQHPRMRWTVSHEGRGIDLALEVLWSGNAKKDLEENVARYAALGIPEYFVFDRRRLRLRGYRLPSPTATQYQALVPQEGRLTCAVLGLELGLEGEKLRFYHGLAPLPETSELIARLGSMVGDLEKRMDDAERRAEDAERALAVALAEIDRLKREGH